MNETNNNETTNKLKCQSCYYFFWILLLLIISYPITVGIFCHYQNKAFKKFLNATLEENNESNCEKINELGKIIQELIKKIGEQGRKIENLEASKSPFTFSPPPAPFKKSFPDSIPISIDRSANIFSFDSSKKEKPKTPPSTPKNENNQNGEDKSSDNLC